MIAESRVHVEILSCHKSKPMAWVFFAALYSVYIHCFACGPFISQSSFGFWEDAPLLVGDVCGLDL